MEFLQACLLLSVCTCLTDIKLIDCRGKEIYSDFENDFKVVLGFVVDLRGTGLICPWKLQ